MGHFWGFQADEASLEKQRKLMAAINTQELRQLPGALYPNLLCLAPFVDTHVEPERYYRAKILHIMGSNVEVRESITLVGISKQSLVITISSQNQLLVNTPTGFLVNISITGHISELSPCQKIVVFKKKVGLLNV